MRKIRNADHIRKSPFFDEKWYRKTYLGKHFWKNPAEHYLSRGVGSGFDPGPDFSTRGYLAANPDVDEAGMNPLLHYELFGRAEGRRGFEPAATVSRTAVIVHASRPDGLGDLRQALEAFPDTADRYVSFPRGAGSQSEAVIRASVPGAIPVCVEDTGQDVGAFLQVLETIDRGKYDVFCKLPSRTGHALPAVWQEALLTGTVGPAERVAQFERIFRENPNVLSGGARELFLHGPSSMLENAPEVARLLHRGEGADAVPEGDWGVFSGTALWLRSGVVDRLLRCLNSADVAALPVRQDGQRAHVVDSLIGLLVRTMGGHVALASCVDPAAPVEICQGLPDEAPRHPVPLLDVLRSVQSRRIALRMQRMKSGQEPGLGFSRAGLALTGTRHGEFAIITPTGDRPVAFNQCRQMVATQSVRPAEWIVVDDGITPITESLSLPEWATYVRRPPRPDDPPHSLSRNVLVALDHVTADKVLIFEDDDWYAPLYAEFLLPWLDVHDLVGLHLIRYYHLRGSAWKHGLQPAHTAFAQSAFRRGPAWSHLAQVCRTEHPEIRERGIVDRHWWQTFDGSKHLVDDHPALHLGLKGGFGRRGLASGHERRETDYIPDPEGAYLAETIGPDRSVYARWQKTFRKPYVVYTCCTDGRAAVHPPDVQMPHCDFYAFTTAPDAVPAPWQAVPVDERLGTARLTEAKPMSLPHLYFPEYEWSLWVPPGPLPREDLGRLVARAIEAEADLALTGGEQGVILRRHNSPTVARAMVSWWQALQRGEESRAALVHAAETEGVVLLRL